MKRRLVGIFITLILGCFGAAFVSAQTGAGATETPEGSYVIRPDIYVRGGPGDSYVPVGQLQTGAFLFPVSRSNDGNWVMIRYNARFGWIRRDLAFWAENIDSLPVVLESNLTPTIEPGAETATPFFPTATPGGNWVQVGELGAFVRAGPGRTYLRIGTLFRGDLVEPVGRNESAGWIMIRYNNGFGWIARNLVRWAVDVDIMPVLLEDALTPSVTPTATRTPSPTATATHTLTPTATLTASPTNTATTTPSVTPTSTSSATPTATPSSTPTATLTLTPTATATVTATQLPTITPSSTSTPTFTATASPTSTLTVTATYTSSPTASMTANPTQPNTATEIPSATQTLSPTVLPTTSVAAGAVVEITPTALPITETPIPPSSTPVPATSTATLTSSPTDQATLTSTASATVTITASPTQTIRPSATVDAATATPVQAVIPNTSAPATSASDTTLTPVPQATLTPEATGEQSAEATAPEAGIRPELIVAGIITAAVLGYAALYLRELNAIGRYKDGYVIDQCPVCGKGHLILDSRQSRLLGLPRVRRTARCDNCRTILRETGTRRWRFAVDWTANNTFYERYNGKEVDEDTLVELVRDPILPGESLVKPKLQKPFRPPSFEDDNDG